MSSNSVTSGVYGSWEFKPVTDLSIQREAFKTPDNTMTIGGLYRVTVSASYLPETPIADARQPEINPSSPTPLTSIVSKFEAGLFKAMRTDYQIARFYFSCDGEDEYAVYGRPFIENVSIESPNQWSQSLTYTVDMVFPASSLTGCDYDDANGGHLGALNLQSISTNYDATYLTKPYSFGSEQFGPILEITRTVNAQGLTVPVGNAVTDYPGGRTHDPVDGTIQDIGCNFKNEVLCDVDHAAIGLPVCSGTGDDPTAYHFIFTGQALNYASQYISGVFGSGGSGFDIPPLAKNIFSADGAKTYLTDRTVSISEFEGTIDVNDTFLAIPTGTDMGYAATETFNFSVDSTSDNGLTTVNINGDIQGYADLGISGGVFEQRHANSGGAFGSASGYFNALLDEGRMAERAEHIYSGSLGSERMNCYDIGRLLATGIPLSKSFSYNISEGTINYAISYDDKAPTFKDGVLSETISFNTASPVPVIAQLTVLGRANGPLMQDIGTVTAYTADLNIEAVVCPNTGSTMGDGSVITGWRLDAPDYDDIVLDCEAGISGTPPGCLPECSNSIFRTADNETWDFKGGRYTRAVSWVYTPCITDCGC